MIWLNVAATAEVPGQRVRVLNRSSLVQVAQSRLLSVCVWQPTEKVIEAAILYHDNDDMLDAGVFG
jgi:hypothetical protein